MKTPINLFWFRRDLRLDDNTGLYHALQNGLPVLPVFLFDTHILEELDDRTDARVSFIYQNLEKLQKALQKQRSSLWVGHGDPLLCFEKILRQYEVKAVFTNRDYEPYALERDARVQGFLQERGVAFSDFKDQVVFEKDEILKPDGSPYTVYTPYSKAWKARLKQEPFSILKSEEAGPWLEVNLPLPPLAAIGFEKSTLPFPPEHIQTDRIAHYDQTRNYPPQEQGTSHLSVHLRFGTISVRKTVARAQALNEVFFNELIWREFFMQILYHYPKVVTQNFYPKYDKVAWRNDPSEFERWCAGETGFPMVDAGMRALDQTGYMHNRARMIAASFLCKDLLIDWRWGEAYFAKKLLDYELASNNGNWQWAAGTGVDAAPYFRIFNPETQASKFDPEGHYRKRWLPEWGSPQYPKPMVDHREARRRALERYAAAKT